MSFGTSLITNIVENLQLNIKNVHIRYEDSTTVPDYPFCFGVAIESLTAQSCDINWIPGGFTSNWAQNDATFKLIELNSLSFYLDSLKFDGDFLSGYESSELSEWMNKLKNKSQSHYIIKPVSAQAKLKRDRSEAPLRTRSRPRLTCNLIWNEIYLSLKESQYNALVNGLNGLYDLAKYKQYRLIQPRVSVKENVRAWWIFAAQCHGFFRHQNAQLIARNNIRYIKICMKIIENPNETLSTEDKEFKESIEKERYIDDLQELREICMYLLPPPNELKNEASNNQQGRSMLLHWFPQWWGWYGQNAAENSNNSTSSSSTSVNTAVGTPLSAPDQQSNFEDELLNALTDTVESNSILKRDAVFGKFQFVLKKGTLDVLRPDDSLDTNLNERNAMKLHFEELVLNVESRPRSGSHLISLSLGSILLKDFLTPNTQFPDLIKPQSKDELLLKMKMQKSRLSSSATSPPITEENEPLFQIEYESKPFIYNTDNRLLIKSRSLDIVYNTDVLNWIIDFLSKPHLQSAQKKFAVMKHKTKMELKKNLNDIIEGRLSKRKTWTFEIDISAPQILFVENFIDRLGSTIVVIDFGRFQLSNATPKNQGTNNNVIHGPQDEAVDISIRESEDDELFLTPCSTPPDFDQEISESFQTPLTSQQNKGSLQNQAQTIDELESLNENTLYLKIYDRYEINLMDIQILVCKGKERWAFASSKGTSNLHVLDRFNITLHLERRIVQTIDPQFPSLTLCGSLPKLNAHINESKILSLTNMLNKVWNSNVVESPHKSAEISSIFTDEDNIDQANNLKSNVSKLILLQFTIDQMSLEVQSCGRSIAELQVSGVKTSLTQRECDTNLSLSVHGLLLVDAMQSYGQDFELLVASHRHVGMDSLSGSLRQSEPCSPNYPNSPGSPDGINNIRPTSPLSLSKAISSLQRGKHYFLLQIFNLFIFLL